VASPFGCRSGHIPLSRKPPCPGTGRLARASALLLMHRQRSITIRDGQHLRRHVRKPRPALPVLGGHRCGGAAELTPEGIDPSRSCEWIADWLTGGRSRRCSALISRLSL